MPTPPAGTRSLPEAPGPSTGGPAFLIIPNRLIVGGLIAALLATVCGLVVLGELAFRRWAPWVEVQGMGAVVAMVWMYHAAAIFRRQRPVISGLIRAFAFAGATAALIAGALYLAKA